MPPKTRISRERIADGAFALVRRDGIDALSAKNLAKELSCSTQPLFWWYANMEEIKSVVLARANSMFEECLKSGDDGANPYKAIGINYIRFAKLEKKLFTALFMSDSGDRDVLSLIEKMPFILDALNKQTSLDKECALKIMREMWLFAHGIATMTATDTAEFSDEEVNAMLTAVFQGVLLYYGKGSDKQ